MNNKAWSHLPNAAHIDRVIESLRTHRDISAATQSSTRAGTEAFHAAEGEAWEEAYNAVYDAARYEDLAAAWTAVSDAAWKRVACARVAAQHSILALIAYDDCDEYLSMTYKELYVWAELSGTPQAILLLPMKWIQEHECLVTPT